MNGLEGLAKLASTLADVLIIASVVGMLLGLLFGKNGLVTSTNEGKEVALFDKLQRLAAYGLIIGVLTNVLTVRANPGGWVARIYDFFVGLIP